MIEAALRTSGKIPEENERLARFAMMGAKTVEQDLSKQTGIMSTEEDLESGIALIRDRTSTELAEANLLRKETVSESSAGKITSGQVRPIHL